MSTPDPRTPWHARAMDEVFALWQSAAQGLSQAEADARRAQHGANTLSAAQGTSWARRLRDQLTEPLIVVLILSACVSVALGDHVDAAVIAAVVALNTLIGMIQEHRAEQAILALSAQLSAEATTLRDGHPQRIDSAALVPGDVVILRAGDTVPADLRLFDVRDLQVDESALTGESVAALKADALLEEETPLGDRLNMAFAGAPVLFGQAHGLVIATGDTTQTGALARLIDQATALETPLTRRIAQLSRALVWIIMSVAVAVVLVELARGAPLGRTFNAAVALAVGAIPEGLPAAVTIALALGVSSMAKRGAIVRRLPAVETLGSTTIICSDKTGTLTQNQMTVTTLLADDAEITVTGGGLEPRGELRLDDAPITTARSVALLELLRAGALCNDTLIRRDPEGLSVQGDPTEAALTVAAQKAQLDDAMLATWTRRDTLPFESANMYMATLHEVPGAPHTALLVKGSAEVLLPRCDARLSAAGERAAFDQDATRAHLEAFAARGLRVLVVARRLLPADTQRISHDDLKDLTLLGLVGMIDPPRDEAGEAVRACQHAGIAVKMITGDHALTASAIAQALGIHGERDAQGRLRTLTGADLARLDDQALAEQAERVAVFARVAPEQKLALVRALQSRGHIVAMTGDGVNDAPALKQADLGVAMGQQGTEVARGAAAMILTDDHFSTIAAAVEEGRSIHDNLVKFMAWSLPTNGGEGVVLLAAILMGTTLPVLPVQLLWINLVTAVLLGTALILEPHEPGLMDRPPRHVDAPLIDRALAIRAVLVSLVVGGAAFVMFRVAQSQGLSEDACRTVAMNGIVVVEVGYLFACRSLRLPAHKLSWRPGNPSLWIGASLMLIVQLLVTYTPWAQRLFHTAYISPGWWAVFTGAGLLLFLAAEARKLWVMRRDG